MRNLTAITLVAIQFHWLAAVMTGHEAEIISWNESYTSSRTVFVIVAGYAGEILLTVALIYLVKNLRALRVIVGYL